METPKVQTRKNENIITTNVPEQMFGKYLVENLKRKWKEKFLDKDTGEVIEVERTEFVLERGTYLQADQLAVIQFHMQAGDIDGELKVSDQKRLAVFSTGWGLVPWCVTCRISEKNHNFILLARNIFQALDIVTDYVELHYDKSFSITTARGFKSHIFLQDDTTRLQEEDGTEKPEVRPKRARKPCMSSIPSRRPSTSARRAKSSAITSSSCTRRTWKMPRAASRNTFPTPCFAVRSTPTWAISISS